MSEPLPERPLIAHADRPAYSSHQIHHKVFTARQCRRIVELGSDLPHEQADLEGEDRQIHDDSIRDAVTSWIAPGPDTNWIFTKLATVVERANRRYGFELTAFEEDLQLTRYSRPGAFYTWHQDGLDGPVAHRKLSLVVQLSDPADYAGAELELFDVSVDYSEPDLTGFHDEIGRQGTVTVFPAFEYHRVSPLQSGERHSLVAWVSGPPFR